MIIHKFGGASVKDAEGVINVGNIIKGQEKPLLIVVSATGKTTNALEAIVDAYISQNGEAHRLLDNIKRQHLDIASKAGIQDKEALYDILDAFVEIEWLIDDEPTDAYDYIYDQIVSVGEIVSSKILYHYLLSNGEDFRWLDVRDVLITDEVYRNAKVDWNRTESLIRKVGDDMIQSGKTIVTQGFIGTTMDNHTTTLGREGSDYTAAIFGYCLDASHIIVWKDVDGLMNADPKQDTKAIVIPKLSYEEAIEMAYYGAKVIHPKTIKPLQNKNIPLYIKAFNNPDAIGTRIALGDPSSYPPITVHEDEKALVEVSVNDFSFIAEEHLSDIFTILASLRIKVSLMRNSAISFTLVINNDDSKIKKMISMLGDDYTVEVQNSLSLITVRYASQDYIDQMLKNLNVVYKEKLDEMVQIVYKK